ncbi:MFS transporter [Streptomyces sp. AM 4-1-1]|uniref:MFS transporter n=1 Tax=Streptomyces sp. AM 4-1-1 TaxID=3028710 RepID=UPI0023B8E5CD|nr:MFS transporter [Streptomyces sp. AM 4-1-1]WEH36416.1 MFS transporter [Streptomyces sp. AM 4-1-1]
MTEEESAPRRWAVLAVLLAGMLMGGMDLTILNVALPTVGRELLPSSSELLWITDGYPLTVAATLVVCSTVGDRVGRKRLLVTGVSTFALASLAAALSSAPGQLIAARAVQGLGYAMMLSSTVVIIRVVFPVARERSLAYGLWVASSSTGAALGPVLGGVLVEKYSWGAVFLVNVPIAVLAVVAVIVLVPESRNPDARRFDVPSALLSILGLAGAVYALQHIGQPGNLSPVTIAVGVASVALLVTFTVRQRRITNPLLDMRLFTDRRFSVSTVSILVCYGAYTGLLFLLTQQLQLVDGYSPLKSGLTLVPVAVASALGGVVAPKLAAAVGNRWGVTTGVSVLAVALIALAAFGAAGNLASLVGVGLGAGMVMTLGADSMMTAAPPERAAEAGAVQEVGFSLGAGLGVAAMGIIVTLAYGANLDPVGGLTSDESDAASESLSAAMDLADRLPGPAGGALRAGARSAYETGFSVTTATVAAALLILAALTAVLLRPAGPAVAAATLRQEQTTA